MGMAQDGTGKTIEVDDPDDPRLDDFRRLAEPRYRRRLETASLPGFFIAEGAGVVERLLGSGLRVRAVLVTPARRERLAGVLGRSTAPVYVAPPQVLRHIVGFDLHRGVLAAAERPPPESLDEVARRVTSVAVLEGLNDHENLGAVFRSASALGAGGVVLDPTCCDPFYRRSVRVSMGAAFLTPTCRAVDWPDDLARLRTHGFTVAALTPDPSATPIDEVSPIAGKLAVMLGAEGPGLSAPALAAADIRVRIPMRTSLDSLNVGHAAAIAFHRLIGGP